MPDIPSTLASNSVLEWHTRRHSIFVDRRVLRPPFGVETSPNCKFKLWRFFAFAQKNDILYLLRQPRF